MQQRAPRMPTSSRSRALAYLAHHNGEGRLSVGATYELSLAKCQAGRVIDVDHGAPGPTLSTIAIEGTSTRSGFRAIGPFVATATDLLVLFQFKHMSHVSVRGLRFDANSLPIGLLEILRCDSTTISSCSFTNQGQSPFCKQAVLSMGGTGNRFVGNDFDVTSGVQVGGVSDPHDVEHDAFIVENRFNRPFLRAALALGVSRGTIAGNRFQDSMKPANGAINLLLYAGQSCEDMVVQGNSFENVGFGVRTDIPALQADLTTLTPLARVDISDNVFTDITDGSAIGIVTSASMTISHYVIRQGVGIWRGIDIRKAAGLNVLANTIEGRLTTDSVGIYLGAGAYGDIRDALVTGNVVSNFDYGVMVRQKSPFTHEVALVRNVFRNVPPLHVLDAVPVVSLDSGNVHWP